MANTFDSSGNSKFYFSHPRAGTLVTDYGVNNIRWTYELNTANYQTYAGEVVQILSVFVGDITMGGQVATYAQMSDIYHYFSEYMQMATQGTGAIDSVVQGTGTNYNEQPIKVEYPHRNWTFYIQPKAMPGFRYGRDIVVPEWALTSAVYDQEPFTNSENVLAQIVTDKIALAGDEDLTFDLKGEIGFDANNPFQVPFPDQGGILGRFNEDRTTKLLKNWGSYHADLVESYSKQDFSDLFGAYGISGPAG